MMLSPFGLPARPTFHQWLAAKMQPTSMGANKNRPKPRKPRES